MGLSFSQITPWGLVAVIFVAFLTGYIVPRTYMNDLQEIIKTLREAWRNEHQARVKAEKQRDELLDQYAQTTVKVIAGLPISGSPDESAARALDPGGDPDAVVAS